MLLAASALKGYSVEAQDGAIGTVSDLLLDDRTWQIRWLVVDTGGWLTGRKVLLHPSAVGKFDHAQQAVQLALSKAQVSASPGLSADQPVSRQYQVDLYGYYGWSPAWGGDLYGSELAGSLSGPARYFGDKELEDDIGLGNTGDNGDPHLRSAAEITGYHVHASDGDIGHVDNLLFDDAGWGVRYLIVDTSNWWMGKQVLMSPYAIKEISWPDRKVYLGVGREEVRASPQWDPAAVINEAYERRLHGHYGWMGYGW